jgi:hypothetical protein
LEWIESANRNEIRRGGLERRFFPTNDRPGRDGPEGELPTALGFEDGKSAGKTLVRDEGARLGWAPGPHQKSNYELFNRSNFNIRY